MNYQARLQVVNDTHPDDSLFVSNDGIERPIIKGNEDEDLLCGACGSILGQSVSRKTILLRLAVPHRLVTRCPKCNANNVLRATKTKV